MADQQTLGQSIPLRSGYFDSEAFAQKSHSILVLKTAIAGMEYHIDPEDEEDCQLLESLVPGTELKLFRDPENEHDEWAIAVYSTDDRQIGYVTRFKNEAIARLMDCGKVFHAFVDNPPETLEEELETRHKKAYTENYSLPFSIYMDD